MKVVCLIRNAPALVYFVNEIHRAHPVSLIVIETPKTGARFRRKLKREGALRTAEAVARQVRQRAKRGQHTREWQAAFGDAWRSLPAGVEVLETDNINAAHVAERIERLAPELILDHGTSIVRKNVLQHAQTALNLHWGLSPYYRGVQCTEWALINWDPHNIGVTVHALTKRIDGGDIVGQDRVTVAPDDTVNAINMRLTVLGTRIMQRAVHKCAAGESLSYAPQDFAQGYLTRGRQWSPALTRQIERLEADGFAQMLKRPSRKARLPIVEID